jgi:hypothetical protein
MACRTGQSRPGPESGEGWYRPWRQRGCCGRAVRLTAENWQARSANALVSAGFGFVWYSRAQPQPVRPPAFRRRSREQGIRWLRLTNR